MNENSYLPLKQFNDTSFDFYTDEEITKLIKKSPDKFLLVEAII